MDSNKSSSHLLPTFRLFVAYRSWQGLLIPPISCKLFFSLTRRPWGYFTAVLVIIDISSLLLFHLSMAQMSDGAPEKVGTLLEESSCPYCHITCLAWPCLWQASVLGVAAASTRRGSPRNPLCWERTFHIVWFPHRLISIDIISRCENTASVGFGFGRPILLSGKLWQYIKEGFRRLTLSLQLPAL